MTREQRDLNRRRILTGVWHLWEKQFPEKSRVEIRLAIQKDLKLRPSSSFKRRGRKSR